MAEGKGDGKDSGLLTVDRIYKKKEFKSKSFSARWIEEGEGYTFLKEIKAAAKKDKKAGEEKNKKEAEKEKVDANNENDSGADEDEDSGPGKEIWKFAPGEKKPVRMVSSAELSPTGGEGPLRIDGYAFSKNESLLLIYTNSKRVWRAKSRGDYWLLDRSSGELRQIGGKAPPSSLMFAKLSPTGRHVAYVMDGNIYVEDLIDHSRQLVTKRATDDIINGASDWVYEEELRVRDGFRWSPDGKSIAYWQFDESGVRKQTMVDSISGLYPELKSFGYPKVGQRNASCRIGVVLLSSEKTRWMQVPGDPRNHYIARMEWAESSKELVIQQLNRAQNTNRVFLANASDGSVSTILTERDEAWVDVDSEMKWVNKGTHFTWMSDRDGWRHIYLYSRDGKEKKCLTPGAFDVIQLLRVGREGKWVYFIASPDNPAERYLYRVALDGSNLTRLTPASEKRGSHSYKVSPDGSHAIAVSSSLDQPPVTRLVSLPDHKQLEVLEANEDLIEKFKKIKRSPSEFFYVDIGGGDSLHARCLKPPNFDPAKSYPLLIYVYGEPAGQVVRDSWGGDGNLWHLMLAQQGYVIMSFDNRGAAAPRGREFRKASNRLIGILPPMDQAAALRSVLKERSYIDPKQVGIWGWSGGGSMSLNAIFKYPGLYSTAIAIASVPNQRYYDTIYQERYMGLPGENLEGYRKGSPINFAHQLKGDLLIVHGAVDDNCHVQTYEKLVDTLVRHNKPFSMMTYPRGTHSVREGKNTTLHLRNLMTRFIHQHLPVSRGSRSSDSQQ